jgi:uncharacterized protein (TIGR02147 family)
MKEKKEKSVRSLKEHGDISFLIWLLLNSKTISEFLQKLLEEKKSRRPRYSMRSLARELGLSPAMTSQVLSGKRGFSQELLEKVAYKLGLMDQEKHILEILSDLERSRGKVREMLEHRLTELRLEIGQTNLGPGFVNGNHRNRWYFWALYSAFGIDGIKTTPDEFSKIMKLPKPLIEDVLKELCAVGWIRPGLDGHYTLMEDTHQLFKAEFPPLELWELRAHTLNRVQKQIEGRHKDQEIGIAHFPFRPELISKVGEEMDRFVARLKKLAEPPEKATEVYCAYLHVFAPKGDHEG